MTKRKWVIVAALLFTGLALASYRFQHRDAPPRDIAPTGDSDPLPPGKELAGWLLREGRMRLGGGRLESARLAAGLAKILDEDSDHKFLADAAAKMRKKYADQFDAMARDAEEAGNLRMSERAKSAAERQR